MEAKFFLAFLSSRMAYSGLIWIILKTAELS